MIGKWIVIESMFVGRFIACKVVGETKQFWELEKPRSPGMIKMGEPADTYRRKKSSIGKFVQCHDGENAARRAKTITEALNELRLRHDRELVALRRSFAV